MALGALLGALLGTGGPRVPAEGLIGIGAFLVLGGLAFAQPALWRRLHDGDIRALRELGTSRLRRDPRVPAAAALVRELLVARHERERDSTAHRLAASAAAITAGATMIAIALLR